MRGCVFLLAAALLPVCHSSATALDILKINSAVWNALTESERNNLRNRYMVDVAEGNGFGLIVDAQASDESTPGTSGGAALGQAYGSAMYVDRAFSGSSPGYSATDHVGAALLGALVGSALDQPAQRRFRFRYTVKSLDGGMTQIERVSEQPFRQPVGTCVSIPSLEIMSSGVCDTNVSAFRARFLEVAAPVHGARPPPRAERGREAQGGKRADGGALVRCKIGAAAIVNISLEKCLNTDGEVLK